MRSELFERIIEYITIT